MKKCIGIEATGAHIDDRNPRDGLEDNRCVPCLCSDLDVVASRNLNMEGQPIAGHVEDIRFKAIGANIDDRNLRD